MKNIIKNWLGQRKKKRLHKKIEIAFRAWIIHERKLILKKQSKLGATARQRCLALYDKKIAEGKKR